MSDGSDFISRDDILASIQATGAAIVDNATMAGRLAGGVTTAPQSPPDFHRTYPPGTSITQTLQGQLPQPLARPSAAFKTAAGPATPEKSAPNKGFDPLIRR